jgi:hypothetical protein
MDEVHAEVSRMNREMGVTDFNIIRLDLVCDFCSTPGIVSTYQTQPEREMYAVVDGEHAHHHMDEDGKWGACPDCDEILTRLLEAGKLGDQAGIFYYAQKLGQRSYESFKARNPGNQMPVHLIAQAIANAHGFFFSGWDLEPGKRVITDDEIMNGDA